MTYKNEFKLYATKARGINPLTLGRYNKFISDRIMNPTILEERQLNVTQMDVFSRLMLDRIIFLGTDIDDDVANIIQAQLLFLESVDNKADIQMYINSPGGQVYSGLGIYDTMQYINPDVNTTCTGLAASMASILLCAGTSGKRRALEHSRVMIHQPSGGTRGQSSDMEIAAKEIIKIKSELYEIMSKHTGKNVKQIEKDCDRDHWMTAQEALNYHLIDEIVNKK